MSKVLVTGAGGFIGSHLVERLVAEGAQVCAFVEYDPRRSWGWLDDVAPDIRDAIEVIAGDVRDSHAVRQAMSGCETVFHLTALIGTSYSYLAPESYVAGTLNVVQAATDLGVSGGSSTPRPARSTAPPSMFRSMRSTRSTRRAPMPQQRWAQIRSL